MKSLNPQKFKRLREEESMEMDSMMMNENEMSAEDTPVSEGFINRNSMEIM